MPAEIWNQVMRVAHQGMLPEPLPGTVVSRPGPDALDGFGDALFVSNGPRVPRVVQYHEVLPWADRGTVQDATRLRSDVRAEAAPLPLSHPMSNIGDDFIARALADEPERRPEAMAADEPIEAGQGVALFGDR